MSDIIITPNKGSANAPTIQFSGSANASASIRLEVLPEGQVAFLGKSGSLFSISDNMVGSLMAVSDISGLPILEVFSDDRIIMGKYNKNTLYVSGTNVGVRKVPLNAVLDVSGSVAVTGSLGVAGSILADGGVTASLLGTASYALNALTASYSYSGTSGTSGTSGISGGTANYVARFTGATTLSTGVIYDNATNVGIGTTTPGLYDGEGNDLVVFKAATAGITIAVSDTSSRTSIKFADGTTGSEAYRGGIEYDHGTGLGGTADSLHFRTAAALRMSINESGNVGIGIITPSNKLTVYDATAQAQAVFSGYSVVGSRTNTDSGTIRIGTNAAFHGRMDYDAGGSTTLSIDNVYDNASAAIQFRLRTAGTPVTALSLLGDGGVGIGTASPGYQLAVSNNGAAGIELGATNGNFGEIYAYNRSSSAYIPLILQGGGGNVGIGTTSPTSQLTIYGAGAISAGVDDDNRAAFGYSAGRLYFGTRVASVNYFDALNIVGGNILIGTTSDTGLAGSGGLKINSSTAGSSNAGALVVQGGISVGNTGSATSYFGGAVTATGTLRATNGNLYTYGESGNATEGILFFNSAANNYIYGSGSQLAIYTAGVQRATISSTGATFAGAVTAGAATFDRLGLNSNPINTVSTAQSFARFQSTGADFYTGTESSISGSFFPSSTAYAAVLYNSAATPMHFYTSGTLRATISAAGDATFAGAVTTGGKLLVNTSVDSSALLQVGTNTTNLAGGMIFGTDTKLYRGGNSNLKLDGTNPSFDIVSGGTVYGRIETDAVSLYISSVPAASLILRTNQTTALTLSSAQAATFAGAVTVSGNTVNIGGSDSSPVVNFKAADTGNVTLNFGGTTNPDKGRIVYSDNSDLFDFYTADTARMRIGTTGTVTINSTTAGSSNAGALVVAGGLATGAASYLGGNTTVNGEFRASNIRLENGTFIAFGSADGEGMTGNQSANSLTLRTNSTTALTINSAQAATFAGAVTVSSTTPTATLTRTSGTDSPRLNYGTGTDSAIIGMSGTASGLVGSSIEGDLVLRTAVSRSIRFTVDGGTTSAAVLSSTGATFAGDLSLVGNEKYLTLNSDNTVGSNGRARFRAVGSGGGSGYGGSFVLDTRTPSNNYVTALSIDSSQAATFAGTVSISSTTAGASNAGALVVQGGISVGNTGSAASYFGGTVRASSVGALGKANDVVTGGSVNDFGIGTYGTATNIIFATGTGYLERARISDTGLAVTGDLLVGSSTTLGTASPTAISVVGRLRSYQGSASVANTAYVDVPLTMPRGLVAYFAMSGGNSGHQSAGFFRANDNGASCNYTLFSQSENSIAVTMSPTAGNIRITNNTGATETITYTFTMLAGQ